jgi:hypothetical protein
MRKSALATVLLATLAFTGAANASLMGVKSVTITNAANQFLQVSEFQAFMNGTNVALATSGAVATTTSGSWDANSTPGKAIDGAYSNLNFPNMYHNANGTIGNLTITFAAVDNLDSFSIYGRSDCCSNRDIYNVSFFGVNGNLLYTAASVDATNAQHMASRALPEPGSIALFGLGLVGLAGVTSARRRKQQA